MLLNHRERGRGDGDPELCTIRIENRSRPFDNAREFKWHSAVLAANLERDYGQFLLVIRLQDQSD